MSALVTALVLFLSFVSSVLAGSHAIPHGDKNTGKAFPRTAGLASGALDPSLFLSASKLPLLPIELPAEAGLRGILTMDSTEAQLCPHFAFKNFALANPDKTRYSAPWRVACGVDFYGGDLFPEPVTTQDGAFGCSVICQQTSKCRGAVFWPSSDNTRSGNCYLKKTLSDPISRAGFAAVVRRNDLKPDLALTTDKRFFEGQRVIGGEEFYQDHFPNGDCLEANSQYRDLVAAGSSLAHTVTSSVSAESVSNTSWSTFVAVSTPPPPSSTLVTGSTSSWSTNLASSIALVSALPSAPSASPSRTTYATDNETETTTNATSSFKIHLDGISTVEWKSTLTATSHSHESTRPKSSLRVSSEGWPTDFKPTATPFVSSEHSGKPTHSSKVGFQAFTTDVASMASPSSSVDAYESKLSFPADIESNLVPTKTARPMLSFKVPFDLMSSSTESAHGVGSSKPTSSSKVKIEGVSTDIEWISAPTAPGIGSESSPAKLPFKSEGFSTDVEWNSLPTETARPTVSLEVHSDWTLEWKSTPTASVASSQSYQADPLPTYIGPGSTLRKPNKTATATPTEVTETLQVTSSYDLHSSDDTPSATGVANVCAMLNGAQAGRRVPIEARDVKACGEWLKTKRPVPTTQSHDNFSQFLKDTEALERILGDEEAVFEFLKALNSSEASEKAAVIEYLKSLDVKDAAEEPKVPSFGRPCRNPCDFVCDSDDSLSVEEKLSRCHEWESAQISSTVEKVAAPDPTQIPDEAVEDDAEPLEADPLEDGPLEAEPAPSTPATLTKYMTSTVFAGPVIVTRTRSAESTVSSTEIAETTEIGTIPTFTQSSAATEASTPQTAHKTDTTIDAASKELAMITRTLLVAKVPAQATQTAPCVQLGQSCESMVVVFAPLATPTPSQKEGTSFTGHIAHATTFAASNSTPPAQAWPTRTLHVAANIMPSGNPMTVACSLWRKGDVDCNKFASIIMTVVPMPTLPSSDYKTFITHTPIGHAVTESSVAQATPSPSTAVSQGSPINVPAPSSPAAVSYSPPANVPTAVQDPTSIAASVTPQSKPVQITSKISPSAVSPTGWVYGPPPRPYLPPPFGKGETASASTSVAHEDTPSVSVSVSPTSASSGVSSATVVLSGPLPSETVIVPISSLSSGTVSVTPSASLVRTSTLATESSPKPSAGDAGNRYTPGMSKPGMGDYRTFNKASAATGRFRAPLLLFFIPLFAGLLVMS
ncbi:hypothetical protein PMIN01_02145 [Paraphaeosphaeria minitans]|uniref:Apple domain-containing protein n=1 Tax=Paraphaeosphaeria minitans TaxID=565426 RepID=A0A9P6KUZ2_9PLEO|nr:hypothetical protein PMIN01_02145 [Paraphaeosphaeria minitans]